MRARVLLQLLGTSHPVLAEEPLELMEAATKSLTSSGSFTGAWECLRGWWTRSSEERLREAEAALLRSAVSHSKLKITDVPIGCDGHTVHTLCVSQGARTGSGLAPVVLIHGYFMGSGSWAHSLDSLASTGRNVYSIDWPGWGLSSKLEFPLGQARSLTVRCVDFRRRACRACVV